MEAGEERKVMEAGEAQKAQEVGEERKAPEADEARKAMEADEGRQVAEAGEGRGGMEFRVNREVLLRPLQLVSGVIERRSSAAKAILKNIQLKLTGGELTLTGTDLEVEWSGKLSVKEVQAGETTVSADKLLEICRELPENAELKCKQGEAGFVIECGHFSSTHLSLPTDEFPSVDVSDIEQEITLDAAVIRRLIQRVSFSMAQQDVRYYLNGALFELTPNHARLVATNGHRLAMSEHAESFSVSRTLQVILPRKGVLEMQKLVGETDGAVAISVGTSHLRATLGGFTLTTKLVDGKYPDYSRVIPQGGERVVVADREELRQALSRTSVMTNDKFRSVRLDLKSGVIELSANNPEQEKAEDTIAADYQGEDMEVGFNFLYLLDVLRAMDGEKVQITLADSNSSALIGEPDKSDSVYVVMPMKL